jgi:hypothetical protein
MEPERIELSARERERLKILHAVEQGHLRQIEAARRLRLTDRQVRRLQEQSLAVTAEIDSIPQLVRWSHLDVASEAARGSCATMVHLLRRENDAREDTARSNRVR